MTLITSSWSLTFDNSDVTNAINYSSRRWKVRNPLLAFIRLWLCEHWMILPRSFIICQMKFEYPPLSSAPSRPDTPQRSFTSIFIPTRNQHKRLERVRNGTINKASPPVVAACRYTYYSVIEMCYHG